MGNLRLSFCALIIIMILPCKYLFADVTLEYEIIHQGHAGTIFTQTTQYFTKSCYKLINEFRQYQICEDQKKLYVINPSEKTFVIIPQSNFNKIKKDLREIQGIEVFKNYQSFGVELVGTYSTLAYYRDNYEGDSAINKTKAYYTTEIKLPAIKDLVFKMDTQLFYNLDDPIYKNLTPSSVLVKEEEFSTYNLNHPDRLIKSKTEMRLKKVSFDKIPDDTFKIPKEYKKVPYDISIWFEVH